MKTYGLTDKGLLKDKNEDSFLIRELPDSSILIMVADGLGGNPGGDLAAQIISDVFAVFACEPGEAGEQLQHLLASANEKIISEAEQKPELDGMASTLTAALVRDRIAYWIHVGDSRLYVYRQRSLEQITVDQNLAQSLVAEGELSPEQARVSAMRNMLDECVGSPYYEPAVGSLRLEDGDVLLLCTDGVHQGLSPETMAEIMFEGIDLKGRIDGLLQAALKAGGKDNITMAAVEI